MISPTGIKLKKKKGVRQGSQVCVAKSKAGPFKDESLALITGRRR